MRKFNPNDPKLGEFSIPAIEKCLRKYGCDGCSLGRQSGLRGPVVYRGSCSARKMIIGEGPGREEDIQGKPFVGPAGELQDKIFKSVGWDTNADWYLGNVTKCRFIAEPGSGRQNNTPQEIHKNCCRPYIEREISVIKPHTIVLSGKSAVSSLLPELKRVSMTKLAGRIHFNDGWPGTIFYIMYHPAYMLHAQKDPEKYQSLRRTMWQHINDLKQIVEEQEGRLNE